VNEETIEYVRCPKCGWTGELDECEVLGADEGNVFCANWRYNRKVCSDEFRVEGNVFAQPGTQLELFRGEET
jgi:hypothetical protein